MRLFTRISGTPCQGEVAYHPPFFGSLEVPVEPETITIEAVLDNHGRPAAWLDRKLTEADKDRIAREVFDMIDAQRKFRG